MGSRTRALLVLRSGQPFLADSVVEISANLTPAAAAIAVWVRDCAVCSHLLVGKSLGDAKVQNRKVNETYECGSVQS